MSAETVPDLSVIEHLDFPPPCDAAWQRKGSRCDRVAEWNVHIQCPQSCEGSVLLCGPDLAQAQRGYLYCHRHTGLAVTVASAVRL